MIGFREQYQLCKAAGMVIKESEPGKWGTGPYCMCLVFDGFCHSKKCLQYRRDLGSIEGIKIKIITGTKRDAIGG